MYAEKQTYANPAMNVANSPPAVQSALTEATEAMERCIGEAMGLAEILAERLTPMLTPMLASPTGGGADGKVGPCFSPCVATVNRQRTRVEAVAAQLRDILGRLEV